jgi:hypothetical protein
MQSEKKKERKEIKKRRVILGQTNIHVPSREEEEDAETNQMMR